MRERERKNKGAAEWEGSGEGSRPVGRRLINSLTHANTCSCSGKVSQPTVSRAVSGCHAQDGKEDAGNYSEVALGHVILRSRVGHSRMGEMFELKLEHGSSITDNDSDHFFHFELHLKPRLMPQAVVNVHSARLSPFMLES